MKKRFIALLLSIVTLMSLAVPGVAAADDTGLVVTPASATLPKGGSTELTASALPEGSTPQWQIAAGEVWVDIAGESAATLTLTYAKVASLLRDGVAQLRCVARLNGETVDESESVAVAVDESAVGVVTGGVAAGTVIRDAYVTQGPYITAPAVSAPAVSTPSFSAGSAASSGTAGAYGFAVGNPDPVAPGSPGYTARNYTATYDLGTVTADAGETETATKYLVYISYEFENSTTAATGYTAQLAAGSNFSVTVAHPQIMGYLPYTQDGSGNWVRTDSLTINITNIQRDYIDDYVVRYLPTNVNYTVLHYLQNAENDDYADPYSTPATGLTGDTVPDVAQDIPGFTALLYERPAIAADGSTIVEIYYDRNYYLMNFDLGGGYGVEPIYDRYGASIDNVGTPTKAGYTFKGWSLDGTNVVAEGTFPTTMPAENRTYIALWETEPTAKVTVVFWGENANDEEYSYDHAAEIFIKPGTEFTYSEGNALICGVEPHTHSAACGYQCGQTAHSHDAGCYTLTCGQEAHTHDSDCYSCEQANHTHSSSCYPGTGDRQGVYTGVPDNPSQGQVHNHWVYGKLIYIGNNWYRYNGSTAAGSIAQPTCHTHTDDCLDCGKTPHTHTNYDTENGCYTLTCTTPVHVHDDSCGYNCGHTEHSHSQSCYMADAGMESDLWTFVRSDTVTVAADGSTIVNVYYDRKEFTLTFKYGNNYSTTSTITDKWGADIQDRYNAIAANSGTMWSESQTDGPYTNNFPTMHKASKTFYLHTSSGNVLNSMTYYLENLDGTGYTQEFKTTWYGQSDWGYDGYYHVTAEDFYVFDGFTVETDKSAEIGDDCNDVEFYYSRNSYDLIFNDGYDDVKTESVKFEAPLSTYDSFKPEVPSAYEPGSVQFAGWYLNPQCTGAQYKLSEHTMPADNVLLYAKWEPVTHTVEFYLDETALEAGTKLGESHPDQTVSHGQKLPAVPDTPKNGDYVFVGWFYVNERNEEKAFDFANMPVRQDMKVYGKWSSNVLKEYFIYYKIKDTDTEIADPTTGSALAGFSKTFDAKGGTDLYADYQAGYFPLTQSHNLVMDIDDDEKNKFTFWYVEKDAVPYIVRYVDEEGNALLPEKVVAGNRKAVVTENFVVIQGKMPDAYQKRLIVLGDEAEEPIIAKDENGNEVQVHPDNVITFVYVEDTEHAYYQITHYTQNLDGQTWSEHSSSQAPGKIGDHYTGQPTEISGYYYKETKYFVNGVEVTEGITTDGVVLTNEGLQISLYYVPNDYPYEVRYLEEGTGTPLADPKKGSAKFGSVVSEAPIDIENYVPVESGNKEIVIRIEESETEAKLNIINIYYTERKVTLNYKVVGPAGSGSVSPASETVKIKTGTALGSIATPAEGFRFMGWYENEDCTVPVNEANVNNNRFTPTKPGDVWTADTWYAKFEYDLTDLTITKDYEGMDQNQSAQFTVVTSSDYRTTVIIPDGQTSVTITGLKVGDTVTVTENKPWVWRYTVSNNQSNNNVGSLVLVSDAKQNTVTFTNTRVVSKWLSGENFAVNKKGTATPVRGVGLPVEPYTPAN